MGETTDIAGPSLPAWCLFPVSAVLAAAIFYVLLRTRSAPERYLIFACWFRYMLSAFHEYTYTPFAAGLSRIAVGSIAIVVLGFLILDKRRFFIWPFLPVLIICVVMLVSGFVNQNPKGALEPIVRYAFFVAIAVAFWQSIEVGGSRAITRLLWVFVPALVFQVLSIVLHVSKGGEIDGSVSYIGGYYHEQQFSLILASCFVVVCFATGLNRWLKLAISAASLIGIALANYRTTIVGMAPLVVVQVFTGIPAAMKPEQRNFIRTSMIVLAVCASMAVGVAERDRFADLGTALLHPTQLIKPPESFTNDDRKMLSGRTYLWSSYIYTYDKGTPVQKFVGFGPDSWTALFPRYAHNTAVSYLYELGIAGLAAIVLLWATMASLALKIQRGRRAKVLAAHASFFLLNMATMPHWQIEGNILYALICGYTLAALRAARLTTIGQVRAARQMNARFRPPRPPRGTVPAPAE